MRKIPGVPELAGPRPRVNIADAVALYRARFAGRSTLDFARLFADSTYRWRGVGFPDSGSRLMAPRASLEDQASLRPGSFLVSIASYSSDVAGFRFQITDRGSGHSLSSDWLLHGADSGASGKFPGRSSPLWMMTPWPVSGLLLVQLTNLATAANRVQLLLQFAEPLT